VSLRPVPTVKAVVWDMDGTLINSAAAVPAAFAATVAELGGPPVNTAAVEAAYSLGLPEVILAHLLGRSLRDGEADLYYERLRTAPIRPYPGVRDTLAAMCGRWPTGVFTGSSHTAAVISISAAGLTDLLPVVVGGDEVKRPKPAPDGILEACRRLRQAPSDVAYVGDSPTDLLAARAAGTVAVAASWGYLYSAEAAAEFTLTTPGQVRDLLT